MTPSQRAIEAAARAISDADGSGWDTILGKRECERNRYRALAASAITAALAVDGLCLVPKEPTQSMIDAATSSTTGDGVPDGDYNEDVRRFWAAMIAAANDGEERK